MELNKIICGDALEELKKLPSESIDFCMTSPPYWGLRDYGAEGQLGLEKTFEEYLHKLLEITAEIKRVLKKEGSLFWNHGDCYGTGHEPGTTDKKKGWISNSKLKNENRGRASGTKKCLLGQPWRMALAMIDRQDWILRSDIKWIKQILLWKEKRTIGSVMPTSVDDRFNASGEYLFHFVKSQKYYFNLGAVKIKTATSENRPSGAERMRTYDYDSQYLEELKKVQKRDYGNDDKGGRRSRTKAGLRINNQPEGRAHFQVGKVLHDYYKEKGISEITEYKKNIPNAWLVQTKPGATGDEYHSARYPLELCEIPILTACPEKGTVLDPFLGSGTTAVVARNLGRNYIGIEINPEYVKIAEDRLRQELLF